MWGRPSKGNFPNSIHSDRTKGAFVAQVWDVSMGEGVWNLTFVRNKNDWELEGTQNFLGLINSK